MEKNITKSSLIIRLQTLWGKLVTKNKGTLATEEGYTGHTTRDVETENGENICYLAALPP